MNQPDEVKVLVDEATPTDEFGRDIYAAALKQVLASAGSPLVVALYGAWGSGKTSMMKRLREKLEGRDVAAVRSAATVWFNPWEHSNDDRPAVSLLYAIRKDLELENDDAVQRAFLAIARAFAEGVRLPYFNFSLGRIADAYEKLAKEDVERRTEQSRLRSRFKDVIDTARIKVGNLPIVIFVDDLDRCQPATAVALLEAIKLFFNLDGCIFVLGADREHLEAAVATEYDSIGIARESYLDKIVQFPFTIPALSNESVRDYIYKHTPYSLWNCVPMLAAAAPDNPRQLKRVINSLVFLDYIVRESEISNYDNRVMCALALIQNAAPNLYRHLRRSPHRWSDVASLGLKAEVPEWLQDMLAGSDSRTALEVALRMLPSTACEADIITYLTLRQQIYGSQATDLNSAWSSSLGDSDVFEGEAWLNPSQDEKEQAFLRLEVERRLAESLADSERWYREAAALGNSSAMARLAELLAARGANEEAETWYRASAQKGDVTSMTALGGLLENRGQREEAEDWYRRAADEGNTNAMISLAKLLEDSGNPREAEDWYRRATKDGDTTALSALARLLEDRGEYDEAAHWYERAVILGDTTAMTGFARSQERRGNLSEAEDWYRRAASADDTAAMTGLARLLEVSGEHDEAEDWYRRAADEGNTNAMISLAKLLEDSGNPREAEDWYRRATKDGDTTALSALARLLEDRGEYDEAAVWYERAVILGDATAMTGFARSQERRGNLSEAEDWYRRAASADDTAAMTGLARLLEVGGEYDEAEEWYRRSALLGDTSAMAGLATLLEACDKYEEADAWRRFLNSSSEQDAEETAKVDLFTLTLAELNPTDLTGTESIGMHANRFLVCDSRDILYSAESDIEPVSWAASCRQENPVDVAWWRWQDVMQRRVGSVL